jgi:hypothetical protein
MFGSEGDSTPQVGDSDAVDGECVGTVSCKLTLRSKPGAEGGTAEGKLGGATTEVVIERDGGMVGEVSTSVEL